MSILVWYGGGEPAGGRTGQTGHEGNRRRSALLVFYVSFIVGSEGDYIEVEEAKANTYTYY